MEALRFCDFSFAYAGADNDVLSNVNLSVKEGDFCLLVGGSGSGKTTLLRNACPALQPSGRRKGSVDVLGQNVSSMLHCHDVGYVYQDPDAQIVCDKVWREVAFGLENMGMGSDLMHRRVAEVITYFGLGPIFDRDCVSLSGGQKQMMNLASVIAMNPRIVLLDEPTSQLDPISSERFIDFINRMNKRFGTTVVVATHSPELFDHLSVRKYDIRGGKVGKCDISFQEEEGTKNAVPFYAGEVRPLSKAGDNRNIAISAKNISFSYDQEAKDVLKELSLDAHYGEIVSLVGANASGKTTLLKMIAGILRPVRGAMENVLIDSQAYLPQDVKLLFSQDIVLEELMEWSKSASYSLDDAKRIIERIGLQDVVNSNPFDLSAGQQQKLGLAKMLLCKPSLLLLDEPTKGLDGSSQIEIADILLQTSEKGSTIILATHDLAFASRISDRMALVFDGGISCMQDSRSFCEENLFYVPPVTRFSELWDGRHGREAIVGKGASAE